MASHASGNSSDGRLSLTRGAVAGSGGYGSSGGSGTDAREERLLVVRDSGLHFRKLQMF